MKQYKELGRIHLNNGNVNLTDPRYTENVWCRVDELSIIPGEYICYSRKGANGLSICGIIHKSYKDIIENSAAINECRSFIHYNACCCDSGRLGFFNDYSEQSLHLNLDIFEEFHISKHGFSFKTIEGDGSFSYVVKLNEENEIFLVEISREDEEDLRHGITLDSFLFCNREFLPIAEELFNTWKKTECSCSGHIYELFRKAPRSAYNNDGTTDFYNIGEHRIATKKTVEGSAIEITYRAEEWDGNKWVAIE